MARLFDCTTDYLLGITDDPQTSIDGLMAAHLDKDFNSLSHEEKQHIISYIKFIVSGKKE